MDNERAIEVIKNYVGCYLGFLSGEEYEAMELAIKALEQPQGDLISREALKKEFEKVYPLAVNDMGGVVNKQIYDIIDNAPTVDIREIYQEGHYDGQLEGYTRAINEEKPQGEISLIDKLSIESNGDVINSKGWLVGHMDLEVLKGNKELIKYIGKNTATLKLIANTQTVEQPQGEWVTIDRNDNYKMGLYKCNLCGYKNPVCDEEVKNFCPNCGAQMKGGEQ